VAPRRSIGADGSIDEGATLIYSKTPSPRRSCKKSGRETAQLARKMGVNQSTLDEVPALGRQSGDAAGMVSAYSTLPPAANTVSRFLLPVSRIKRKRLPASQPPKLSALFPIRPPAI
jgi:hypothetical protein